MKLQDIQTYLRLKKELDDLCIAIFTYVKKKYEKQLEFGWYSTYCDYSITKTELCIDYCDYSYGRQEEDYLPDIPLELLESETSWQKFLDNYYEKKKKEKEEKKAKEEQAKENKEREIYERLKKKFEL